MLYHANTTWGEPYAYTKHTTFITHCGNLQLVHVCNNNYSPIQQIWKDKVWSQEGKVVHGDDCFQSANLAEHCLVGSREQALHKGINVLLRELVLVSSVEKPSRLAVPLTVGQKTSALHTHMYTQCPCSFPI